jgi:hypothetical protein
MKCLSLFQPWADLVVSGKKIVELRTWAWNGRTNGMLMGGFRGEFLVHASSKTSSAIRKSGAVTGAIIGKATVVDVVEYVDLEDFLADKERHLVDSYFSDWHFRRGRAAGFILRDALQFRKPIPFKGSLGFFEVPETVVKRAVVNE